MYLSEEQLHDTTWSAVECLLWSSSLMEEEQNPASEYFVAETENWDNVDYPVDPDSVASLQRELEQFIKLCEDDLIASKLSPGQIGHDFILTRNGHGAGFWDLGLGEIGDTLTKWAETFGLIETLYIDTQNCIAWE